MTTPTEIEDSYVHPLDQHAHREPITKGLVRVVVFHQTEDVEQAERIADGLIALLGDRAGAKVVTDGDRRDALIQTLRDADEPLILITDATEAWSKSHLAPLLTAIDRCDHAIGRRRNAGRGLRAWFARLPWRMIFALPIHDLHSCCRLHRVAKLRVIPLQSSSAFLDIEILAKATFLGHLLDETDVPELASVGGRGIATADVNQVLRHPTFVCEPWPPVEVEDFLTGDAVVVATSEDQSVDPTPLNSI